MDNRICRELLKITEKENITTIDNLLDAERLNALYLNIGDDTYISLNKKLADDPVKRNFVLAHELGRHALHRGLGDLIENNSIEIEEQADNYADKLINFLTDKLSYKKVDSIVVSPLYNI